MVSLYVCWPLLRGALAGTITLRDQAIHILPQYQPGLGGLYVLEAYRGQGVGTALVKAGTACGESTGV